MTEDEAARRAAPLLAWMVANAEDSDFVVDADTPALVAAVPPAAARGDAVVSVGVDHGARARPALRLAVDGPGADSP